MVDLSLVSLGLFTSAIIAGVLASVVAAIYMCCHRYGQGFIIDFVDHICSLLLIMAFSLIPYYS